MRKIMITLMMVLFLIGGCSQSEQVSSPTSEPVTSPVTSGGGGCGNFNSINDNSCETQSRGETFIILIKEAM